MQYPRTPIVAAATAWAWIVLGAAGIVGPAAAAEAPDTEPRPLSRVAAGLDFSFGLPQPGQGSAPSGWSHGVLLAKPAIASGDLDSVPGLMKKYAELFSTVILAQTSGGPASFKLQRVGIGLAIPHERGYRTVDAKSPEVGLIGRQVLSTAEAKLAEVREIARYDGGSMFDVPAIVLHQGEHVDRVVRHFVWVARDSGQVALALWLIDRSNPEAPRPGEDSLVWVPAWFEDPRPLHVDGGEFVLGIPGERALAMERLPQGQRAPLRSPLAELAVAPRYSPETLRQFAAELAQAIAAPTQ